MRVTLAPALVVLLLIAGACAMAADWPWFLGPDHNGIASDTGINKDWNARPPQMLWKVTMSDKGYAGPSVADDKVFIIDHVGTNDVVRALDFATGADIWRFEYPDAEKFDYGYARATPTYFDGKLYCQGRMGPLFCLDAATGRQIWARNIRSEFAGQMPTWKYAASPLIDGDKLIVIPGGRNNAAVVALNPQTGETIWTGGGSDPAGYATPVRAQLDGRLQYVCMTGRAAIGVDTQNGQLLWRVPWGPKNGVNAATPIVQDPYAFVSSGYGFGCALLEIAGGNGSIAWQNKALAAHFNSPIFYEGYIFGIGDPGLLLCIDSTAGDIVWRQQGFEKGGIIGVDGCIIAVGGKTGDVVLVEATGSYRELGRVTPLGGQSWTAPIIANGKLLVRNTTALACLDIM